VSNLGKQVKHILNQIKTTMKTTLLTLPILFTAGFSFAQEEKSPDTTRVNLGKMEIIIIDKSGDKGAKIDTIDAAPDDKSKSKRNYEAHWAGLDMGFNVMMNSAMNSNFDAYPYWENDPARSMTWNLNILEHKFKIAGPYVGITTGLGFSFTQLAFRDNYVLFSSSDTLFAVVDTISSYSKNKLRANYLTVPLLIEFATNADEDKSFYLAAGVVGGVRLSSKVKREGEIDGKNFKQQEKGVYGLNPFKLDATVRMGYGSWGAFASYSLMPLFDTGKTTEVYPLTFGLSLNF
jgi:hypothetical protein